MKRRRAFIGAGLLLCGSSFAGQAQAQTRMVRLVVPYGTGGAPDILARLFAQEMAGALGPVVVENKPGAGGTLGADFVAKASADSGILLVTTAATHVINPALYPNFPYDPQRDFTPIGLIAATPLILVTASTGPFRSMADVLSVAHNKPGELTYASAGNGTMQHMAGLLLENQAKIQLTHVPYKGSGQALPDLLSGRVSLMFNSVAAVAPMIREGRLRALAVTSKNRLAAWPEVPTVGAFGLPGFEADAWYAVFGPPGLAPEHVQRISKELLRIMELPAIKERYATLGLEPIAGAPTELATAVRRDQSKWSAFIRERGIRSSD